MAAIRQGGYRYHDLRHRDCYGGGEVHQRQEFRSMARARSRDEPKKESKLMDNSRVRVRSSDDQKKGFELEGKDSRVRVCNGVIEKEVKKRKLDLSHMVCDRDSRRGDEPAEGTLLSPPPSISNSMAEEVSRDSPREQSVEEEDLGLARNIYSSRWAAEQEDVEAAEKRVSSPEQGEVVSREGSESEHVIISDREVAASNCIDVDGDVGEDLPQWRNMGMLHGCRDVNEYRRLGTLNEGTYGVVHRAQDVTTGEIVALKKVKMENEREGFPLTALREINILSALDHPSIVRIKEVVVDSTVDGVYMVMEHMDSDLRGVMETMKEPFSQSEVKCLMLQLLEGVMYLHDNWILHRDLKTSNILINNCGELKICDFGLSRQYGSSLKPYTPLVVTLWYRAPELLLGQKEYSTAIDMWSVGCIMAELLAKQPLFNGNTEIDQLNKIVRTLGTPNERIWPGFAKLPGANIKFVKQRYNKLREKFPATSFFGHQALSAAGFDLLNKLLTYDPEKRITAEDALKHDWFREVPLPKSKDFMPTFPAQNATHRCPKGVMKRRYRAEE